jgi:hypothetical protein
MALNDIVLVQQVASGSVERTFNPATLAGYVPKFTATGFGQSLISDNGTTVTVGGALSASGIAYADNQDLGLTTEGSNTVAFDFSAGNGLSSRAASDTVTFTGSNYRAGSMKSCRVVADGSNRTLNFPSNWVFIGSKPASIAAGKTGILTVTSFGTTEADCVAAWAVQE